VPSSPRSAVSARWQPSRAGRKKRRATRGLSSPGLPVSAEGGTRSAIASLPASSLPRPGLPCEDGSRSISHMAAIQPHPHDARSHCTAAWCGYLSEGGRSMVACSPQEERRGECATMQGQGVWWMCVAFTSVVRSARKPKPISCLHERGVGGASFPCEASCRAHAPPQPRGRGSERTIDARHERQGRTRTTGTGTPKGSGWSG